MNRKGFAPIVIILVVLGVLAVGGGVWYLTHQSASTPSPFQTQQVAQPTKTTVATSSPVTQPSSTAGISTWKTYTSDLGYEIQYPSDWGQLTCLNGAQFSLFSSKKGIAPSCDDVHGPGNLEIESSIPSNVYYTTTTKTVYINGLTATRYMNVPVGQIGDIYIDMVVFTKGTESFTVSLDRDSSTTEQILSTFRFTSSRR